MKVLLWPLIIFFLYSCDEASVPNRDRSSSVNEEHEVIRYFLTQEAWTGERYFLMYEIRDDNPLSLKYDVLINSQRITDFSISSEGFLFLDFKIEEKKNYEVVVRVSDEKYSKTITDNIESKDGRFIATVEVLEDNEIVHLPIYANSTIKVDWGDGSHAEYTDEELEHTYSTAGIYQVFVSGGVSNLSSYDFGCSSLTVISNIGIFDVGELNSPFSECYDLHTVNFGDSDFKSSPNLSSLFANVPNLTTINVSSSNMRYVENLDNFLMGSLRLKNLTFLNNQLPTQYSRDSFIDPQVELETLDIDIDLN